MVESLFFIAQVDSKVCCRVSGSVDEPDPRKSRRAEERRRATKDAFHGTEEALTEACPPCSILGQCLIDSRRDRSHGEACRSAGRGAREKLSPELGGAGLRRGLAVRWRLRRRKRRTRHRCR